jgi:uncharacterized membrane protein
MKRIVALDIFRGFAIFLMVIFHFCYDLNYFNFIKVKITSDYFWVNFRIVIVTMFLLAVGISLKIAHNKKIDFKKVKKRTLILFLSSLAISITTYIIFPHAWVYFGILHFILVASILALPFLNYPKLSLIVGILIILLYNLKIISMHKIFLFTIKYLPIPKYHTVDLAPLIPWFGVVLTGIAIKGLNLDKKFFNLNIFKNENFINKILAFSGRHSLIIYLIHQPIFFAIFFLVRKVI